MENKVFQDNIAPLMRYDPKLFDALKGTVIQNTELTKTLKDEYSLVFKGKELHSPQGAVDEAKSIASKISNIRTENSVVVLFGLGLGYVFDEVLSLKKAAVMVFEPSLEILRATLEVVDLKKHLLQSDVFLCSDINSLKEHIARLSDKETDITVTFLNSYKELFPSSLNDVLTSIQSAHGEKQAAENTLFRHSRAATYAIFINLKNIEKSLYIKELEGRFKNKPAIIVSAGPSLYKNIDNIKKNKDKAVIISTGTALRALLKEGVVPDFMCMVETKDTSAQVRGLDLSDINLILEPFVHSFFWDGAGKNKFLFPSKGNFINDWFSKGLKINNDGLFSKGTVSYCALSAAKLMGLNPIILIGQDLAYTEKSCYTKGSAYEELVCEFDENTKKYTVYPKDEEKYAKNLANPNGATNYLKHLNKNLTTVKGQNGEPLPTQSGYAIFIKHFEAFAKENPSLTLINSSIGGAQIEGFKNVPFGEIPFDETFDKSIDTKKTVYDTINLQKAIDKQKELTQKSLLAFERISELIQKAKKEYRPKNIEKAVEKLHRELEAYNEEYFTKSDVLYNGLCKHFTLMARHKDDLLALEKYAHHCKEDLKRLARYLSFNDGCPS